MPFGSRRTGYYVGLVVAATVVFTLGYNAGMAVLEDRPQPLYHSLEVVFQTFTTTGYGEDAPWSTPEMHLLVIVMQLTGIGLILTAADVFIVPWLRDALAPTAPEAVSDATDHVIVCAHTPRTDAFVEELDARDREYVLVVSDGETASELYEAGYTVVHGDPESTETFENARVGLAVAVVADAADDVNASIALSARAARADVPVITLVEDADLAQYHSAAGATDVLSPRQLLGESLTTEIATSVAADVDESVSIGEDLELVELAVETDTDLEGRTFAEADFQERFGVNVIGAWFDGEFETPVDPTDRLGPGTRLLVAGEPDQVAEFRETIATPVRQFSDRQIVLAGFGDSGRAAHDALAGTDATVTVVDVEEKPGVDVIGDVRDPDVLAAAGIEDAAVLVLTVGDDTTAVLTTLIAAESHPDLQILVRADHEDNVRKLYRAGADYVHSLTAVSGRMLASTVFEDEEVLAYDKQIRVARLPAAGLAGRTLVDAEVRTVTGCTVLAVVRNGETDPTYDPAEFTFEPGDDVIAAGTDEAIAEFERQFGE